MHLHSWLPVVLILLAGCGAQRAEVAPPAKPNVEEAFADFILDHAPTTDLVVIPRNGALAHFFPADSVATVALGVDSTIRSTGNGIHQGNGSVIICDRVEITFKSGETRTITKDSAANGRFMTTRAMSSTP